MTDLLLAPTSQEKPTEATGNITLFKKEPTRTRYFTNQTVTSQHVDLVLAYQRVEIKFTTNFEPHSHVTISRRISTANHPEAVTLSSDSTQAVIDRDSARKQGTNDEQERSFLPAEPPPLFQDAFIYNILENSRYASIRTTILLVFL